MFDRLKRSAREKLQRAVAEVVEAELARRQQQLDEHQQRLHTRTARRPRPAGRAGDRVDERVHRRLYDLEQIARRDILNSQDIAAAE